MLYWFKLIFYPAHFVSTGAPRDIFWILVVLPPLRKKKKFQSISPSSLGEDAMIFSLIFTKIRTPFCF